MHGGSQDGRRIRRWQVAMVAALLAVVALAIPALGAQTKDVTVDPDAAAGAPGFTDLDTLTYADAKARLRQLNEITLPVAVEGLELIDVSGVTLDSNDAGRSLSLAGSARLPALHGGGQDVDLLVTAVWPDDASTEPAIAIAAKTEDLSLTEVNPLWDDSYGEAAFATARLAVASADHRLDPAALPAAAQEFYPEPVELVGGVSFAGDLALEGRLADAFGYAGYSGEVALEGSLGASAAALFGTASDAELGALRLKATLGKSSSAPEWIAERTSTFEFVLEPTDSGFRPGVSVEEDLTIALDGTSNRFQGRVAIAPTGAIEAEVALVGALDAPFGLDALDPSKLSDIALRLALDDGTVEGGLAFGVAVEGSEDPIRVTAGFVTGGGTTRADFAIEGALTVPTLVAFAGDLLGTPVVEVPGAGDVSLDRVSFSFTTGSGERIFSVGAAATIKQLQAAAVLTLRTAPGESATPLLGLRLSDPGCDGDCIRMSSLLPADQAGEVLAGLELPALNLTVAPASLSELAAEDLTPQEEGFFGATYETLPDTLAFSPGVNLQGRLPVDALGSDVREALGFPAGSEVVLAGTLGAGVTLSRVNGGSGLSLSELELTATLPAATESTVLPDWVEPSGPTTLAFRYETGGIAVSFDTAADVTIDGSTFATTIAGRLERAGRRTSIEFAGTIADWQQPFGVSWIDSIDEATVALDTSFGGGQPATLDASVTAATVLGGKRFELAFGLSKDVSTSASLTARFADTATLGEIVRLFPALSQAATDVGADAALDALSIGPVAVSLTVGGAASSFELTATTRFRQLTSDLLISARPGGAFTLGIKARGTVELDDLVPDAPAVKVTLPGAALVLASQAGTRPVAQLTDGEFDFYKSLYGCEDDDEPVDCTNFARLELSRALKLLAAFDLGENVETMASEIGVQTSGSALLTGTIPVFGGADFSLRASLGNFRFDEQPDWYERGDVALEIGANGLRFAGSLDVKIQREGDEWMPDCEGGVVRDTYAGGQPVQRCYDVLNFEIGARVALQPSPSFTLTGALKTTTPWRNAFGQDWLEIRRVALQLGVTLPPTGPEVTMGFQGDIKIGSKDIAAALKVGLAPIPGPPFVRPNLIGFSAASRAGIALSDLVWLNNQITGDAFEIDTATMPDVSLRNLFLQYSQQTDVDLCLTAGVRFNADLYVGTDLPGAGGEDDPSGCRTIDTNPETRQSCIERKNEGCLASVYGRFDAGGLEAGGELSGFDLGPISFEDSMVELSLTPSRQRLRLKGGARIGTSDYEFARGRADLDFSRDGFAFSGDAAMFNDAFHGYLEAAAPFDLQSPSFRVKAWLRADARAAMNGLVGEKAENVRPVIVALGSLLEMVTGSGSVPNVRDLPRLLERAGVTVPPEVRTMANTLGTAQQEIQRYAGPVLTLQPLLKGFSFNVPGVRGINVPRTCITVVKDGRCWTTPPAWLIPGIPGTWVPAKCLNVVVNGTCYFTPPFGVTVPGICAALGISSSSPDCSWAGLMRRYVLPALLRGVERATGLDFDENNFEDAITTLVDRFADGAGSIVNVDCAYFSADATGLARGEVDVDIATRLRLFGHPLEFGASWDFRASGGSPEDVIAGIFRTLFSPSSTTCPALPAGHEEVRDDIPSRKLTATLSPAAVDEAGEVTLSGTFDDGPTDHPAVQVDWGDGSTSAIPAGTSRTVSVSHRYANDGAYPVAAIVQDAGAHTQQLTATVRNVAPSFTELATEPAPSDEHGVVTLRGAFADPGTQDRHEVRVDWGDGSEPTLHTVAAGARAVALEHRYLDDPPSGDAYTVTAVLADDDGGSATRTAPAEVRNVAPSGIRVTPLEIVAAEGEPPAGPVDVTEGAIVTYGIDFDDPGTLDTHTLTVDWGDGDAPQTVEVGAGIRHVELPHRFLDDGTFDVHVAVADDDGGAGAATSPVHVRNVAPEVTAALVDDALVEGEQVRIEGSIKDPGLLDSHTVVIDWGDGRTDADRYETVSVAAGDRTFAAEKPYGDDGGFTIAPVVTDDDGGTGRADLALTVANAAPAIGIDPAGSVEAPGGRTFLARAGSPLELRARATDAGSDDLAVTWTWRDGTTTLTDHLAAPPAADPDPSPQLAPRDLVDTQRHAWSAPCLYEDVAAAVADDDAGAAGDRVDVVVTGTAGDAEEAGFWQREYDPRKAPGIGEATLACYLRIADQMSEVFGPATRADAYDVIHPGTGGNSELAKLDRELLTAWLNFAHGSLRHDAIAATMRFAEQTRLDPAATSKELQRARQEVSRVSR